MSPSAKATRSLLGWVMAAPLLPARAAEPMPRQAARPELTFSTARAAALPNRRGTSCSSWVLAGDRRAGSPHAAGLNGDERSVTRERHGLCLRMTPSRSRTSSGTRDGQHPEGCIGAFMQLVGSRAADRQRGHIGGLGWSWPRGRRAGGPVTPPSAAWQPGASRRATGGNTGAADLGQGVLLAS